jgi:hypothetical protein
LPPGKFPKLTTDDGNSSDLLSRVKSFLPTLQKANEQLGSEPAESMDPTFLDGSEDDEEVEDEVNEVKTMQLKLKPDESNDSAVTELPSYSDNTTIHCGKQTMGDATEEAEDDNDSGEVVSNKESTISQLLNPSSSRKRTRGPLIQELS